MPVRASLLRPQARLLAGIPSVGQTCPLVLEVSHDLGISRLHCFARPRHCFVGRAKGHPETGYVSRFAPGVPQKSALLRASDRHRWLVHREPCTFRYNECIKPRYQAAINRGRSANEGTDTPRRAASRILQLGCCVSEIKLLIKETIHLMGVRRPFHRCLLSFYQFSSLCSTWFIFFSVFLIGCLIACNLDFP